jgi:hypothetical protein
MAKPSEPSERRFDCCNFAGRFIDCVLINCTAQEKLQWDSVVARISNTLASR